MKLQIISLRDIKANLYNIPIFTPNINATLRDLRDMVNEPGGKEAWQKHPEDFELWHIGEWDNESADFNVRAAYAPAHEPKQLLALSTLVNN